MINSLKMDCFSSSFNNQQSKNGIIDDEQHGLDNVSDLSDVSSDSDLFEEVNSSASSSPTSSPASGSSSGLLASGPLLDMSSLLQELPFKRGLSKHYNGKSQSFTSLSNVRCLEDLAKPENPYNKKLKSCRSYAGLLDDSHGTSNQPSGSSSSSRLISRKTSRGSCSSLCVKRNPSFLGTRPPVPPPHRSSSRSSFTTQSPLFALGV